MIDGYRKDIIIILGLVLIQICFSCSKTDEKQNQVKEVNNMAGKVQELTDASFDNAIKTGVTLVDFWAPWCGPCRMQLPINEKLAQTFAGRATIAKINVDEAPQTASTFGITAIPTLMIFKDGKKVEEFVGVQTEDVLSRVLEKHIGGKVK